MAEMLEVRWHARAGQGAKTAAYLLAESAMAAGDYVQAFPEYGAERMGAPMKAFTRISKEPIRVHYGITNPDVVVVLDPSLLGKVDVLEGVPEDGLLLVNTEEEPGELRRKFNISGRKIYTVAATKIALETINRPIPNTPILGALIKATGFLDLERVIENVRETLSKKFRPEVVEGNIRAVERAYQEVKTE